MDVDDDTREILKLSRPEKARVAGGAAASVGLAIGIVALLLAAFVLGNIEAPLFRPSSPAYAQVPVEHTRTVIQKRTIIRRIVVVIVRHVPGRVVIVRGHHNFRHHRIHRAHPG